MVENWEKDCAPYIFPATKDGLIDISTFETWLLSIFSATKDGLIDILTFETWSLSRFSGRRSVSTLVLTSRNSDDENILAV